MNTAYSDAADFSQTDCDSWQEMLKCMDGLRFSADEKVDSELS